MIQEKIWDYFQNEDIDSFNGSFPRLNDIAKKFSSNDKVLNIGIGGGVFEKIASKNGIDVYSLDPNEKSIKNIQKILGKDRAKSGFSQDIPFESNYFDGVVMSEVLEHLDSDIIDKTLKEIARVLTKNGKFIGTVPYNENLNEQIVICPSCGEKFHRWGHIQSFDIKKIKSLLQRGFKVTYIKKKMYISWKTLNYKGIVSACISYIFYKINIKKSGLNIYFEVSK